MLDRLKDYLWPKLLISDSSATWIIDCFDWAITNFDRDEFHQRSRLILPNNQFFPGSIASVEAKAENIFQHSLKYAGLMHWPFVLSHAAPLSVAQSQHCSPEKLALDNIARNSQRELSSLSACEPISISYNRQQTIKPEDLSATYGHLFAQHLLIRSKQLPPGGNSHLLEASEVLAVCMGFGVMLANSAYTFRGGCGSCFNAAANRQSNLSEHEVVFTLALFCQFKKIDKKQATQYLKTHLRPAFAIANRQLATLDLSSQNNYIKAQLPLN